MVIYEILDNFLEQQIQLAIKQQNMRRKLSRGLSKITTTGTDKAGNDFPKAILSQGKLNMINNEAKNEFSREYFEMRLNDFSL